MTTTPEGQCPSCEAPTYPTTRYETENQLDEPGRVIYGGWRCTNPQCEHHR